MANISQFENELKGKFSKFPKWRNGDLEKSFCFLLLLSGIVPSIDLSVPLVLPNEK
jgi:hypothetical protein